MLIVNLEAFGFDTNTSKVYNYLLNNPSRIYAKLISNSLNMPLKAVYAALKELEKSELVETSEEEYPKHFSIINPVYTLSELTKNYIDKQNENIITIQTQLEKAKRIFFNNFTKGSCAREIVFYLYRSDSIEAKEFISDQLTKAKNEILFHLVPIRILDLYLDIINRKANDGIWTGVYILKNQLDFISNLNKQIKAFVVDTLNQRYVSVDNQLYLSGQILIDRNRFIDINFDPDSKDWILQSFKDFNVVEKIKSNIHSYSYQDAFDVYNKMMKKSD